MRKLKIQRNLLVSSKSHKEGVMKPKFKPSCSRLHNLHSLTNSYSTPNFISKSGLFLLSLYIFLAMGSQVLVSGGIKSILCVLFPAGTVIYDKTANAQLLEQQLCLFIHCYFSLNVLV